MPDQTKVRAPVRSATPQAHTRSAPAATTVAPATVDRAFDTRPRTGTVTSAKKQPALAAEPEIRTAGSTGEHHLAIEMSWVEVDGHLPARFTVTTLADHGLEVTIEQLSYRKTYTGVGTVETGLTPIVPVGTKGRLIARDATTDEILEKPWTWYSRGSGAAGLWALIKRLLWKGD